MKILFCSKSNSNDIIAKKVFCILWIIYNCIACDNKEIWNLKYLPNISPSQANCGVYIGRNLKKINCIITAAHYSMLLFLTNLQVFHGADHDIEWLQRDLGIYVVNMFDTGQAARVLNLARHSLAHLLWEYCKVVADKQYQLADWRMRWKLGKTRDHFVYAPSQWETTLQYNVVSHWLGAYTKWSLKIELSYLPY